MARIRYDTHRAQSQQHFNMRKNDVAEKARFHLVATALSLDVDRGAFACPDCHGHTLQSGGNGKRAECVGCYFNENMIGLAMRALNIGAPAALEWLERLITETRAKQGRARP